MALYFGVIGNRDYIKLAGSKRPFWEFLDVQPDGWLTSLVYAREDLPPRLETNYTMIWDCGAWSYRNEGIPKIGKNLVTPEWVFNQYKQRASEGDMLIAPDHMLIPDVDLDARREFNQQSAKAFLEIAQTSPFWPMVTVHGHSLQERIDTAKRYQDMGYTCLALGGLAARASQKSLLLDVVQAIREAVPNVWIHVLGLSSPDYAAAWHEYGINSFDGSSHFKQAFTGGAFFAREGAKLIKWKATKTERGNPDKLLAETTAPMCYCRACSLLRVDGVDTRTYGSNEHNMGRAAHNLNMLMAAQKSAIAGDVVLVSCVGKKLPTKAPAKDLYQSSWFRKARAWAEANGIRWYILSAKHGLVKPGEILEPYELTLNNLSAAERKKWAERTIVQINNEISKAHPLVILAGKRYREHLAIEHHVSVPMQGLGIGQQLQWLDSQMAKQLELF